ncbi:hypothetical protein HA402_005029 [Bradysia odoriphaga]|nr:hypothetical protein HA402_005029 [Bradysia odoriphaga]
MCHESLNKWKCNSCNNDKNIDDLMSLARSEILEQEIGSVPMLEQLIAKYSKLLNPNHYLVVDMKQKLTAILRSFCDHEPTPQPKILQRKIMLCEEILPILRVIQPGISRLTGIALYEYFNSMVELTIYNMNEKHISIQEGVSLVIPEKFQHILRIMGTNIDGKRKVTIAMTAIKGCGRRYANIVLKKADVDLTKRAGECTEEEVEKIITIILNPRQYKIPNWFLNRQKDIIDGKYTQLTSSNFGLEIA